MSTLHSYRRVTSPRLVQLLLGDRKTAESAANHISDYELWRTALALSEDWRVIPQLGQRVNAFSPRIDTDIQQELRRAVLEATAQSMFTINRGSTVISALTGAGIRAVAFKGLGLLGNLYSGPGERTMTDVDLLIDAHKVASAYAILRGLGFSPETNRLEGYVDLFENRSLRLTDIEGFQLDLHWAIGAASRVGITADDMLSRAEEVEMNGRSIHVASALDSMMLSIHHSLQHNFAPFASVKDLCDLAKWWSVQPGRWSTDAASRLAELSGLLRPCLALWGILENLDHEGPWREGVAKLISFATVDEQQDASRLEQLFQDQLAGRIVSPILLRVLMNPLSINQFIMSRISNGEDNIHLTPYKELKWGLPRVYLTRALQLANELVHLNSRRVNIYRSLLRTHRDYLFSRHYRFDPSVESN